MTKTNIYENKEYLEFLEKLQKNLVKAIPTSYLDKIEVKNGCKIGSDG